MVAIRTLMARLGFPQDSPTCVYEDNAACILLSGEPVFRERSKHIDVRYHYLREQVRGNVLQLIACSTINMVADVLTKPLGFVKFMKFEGVMMNFIVGAFGKKKL